MLVGLGCMGFGEFVSLQFFIGGGEFPSLRVRDFFSSVRVCEFASLRLFFVGGRLGVVGCLFFVFGGR